MRSEGIRRASVHLAKEMLWSLTKPASDRKPPLCLFATPRGGSTLLMQALAANRRVTYSDQPLGVRSAQPWHLRWLPIPAGGQLTHLDPEDEAALREYLARICDGRLSVNAPWRFWRPDFSRRWDRIVLKIVNGLPLVEWITAACGGRAIYLTRHPFAVAVSSMRIRWRSPARAYLDSERFRDAHLTEKQIAGAWDVLHGSCELSHQVLGWGLHNLVPLRLLPSHPEWTWCSYESLALNPQEAIDRLSDRLGLEDPERMRASVLRASKSTRASSAHTRRALRDPDSGDRRRFLAGNWQSQIDPTAAREAHRVLDLLEIDLYGPDTLEPRIVLR